MSRICSSSSSLDEPVECSSPGLSPLSSSSSFLESFSDPTSSSSSSSASSSLSSSFSSIIDSHPVPVITAESEHASRIKNRREFDVKLRGAFKCVEVCIEKLVKRLGKVKGNQAILAALRTMFQTQTNRCMQERSVIGPFIQQVKRLRERQNVNLSHLEHFWMEAEKSWLQTHDLIADCLLILSYVDLAHPDERKNEQIWAFSRSLIQLAAVAAWYHRPAFKNLVRISAALNVRAEDINCCNLQEISKDNLVSLRKELSDAVKEAPGKGDASIEIKQEVEIHVEQMKSLTDPQLNELQAEGEALQTAAEDLYNAVNGVCF